MKNVNMLPSFYLRIRIDFLTYKIEEKYRQLVIVIWFSDFIFWYE